MRVLIAIALLSCSRPAPVAPAPPPARPSAQASPTLAEADAHFDAKRFREAAAAYEAIAAQQRVAIRPRLRAAIAYAELGDIDKALAWADRATAGGLPPPAIESNPAFASVIADPRWRALRDAWQPACQSKDHHAFDFWLGTWAVYDKAGTHIGDNTITRELGGCQLLESWVDQRGSKGKSINFYDPQTQRWRQRWIDDTGAIHDYIGTLGPDGAMVMEGSSTLRDGTPVPRRMTLLPNADGTVLQTISITDGTSWTVVFEGTYRRSGS